MMFIVLALIGLGICFFGVRIRKVVLALQGLFFGGAVGGVISILMLGGLSGAATSMYGGVDSSQISTSLGIIVIAAIVFAVISAVFEKLSAFMNCLLSALTLLLFSMLALGAISAPFVIIAMILSIVCAVIAGKYHMVAFVLSFAVTGSLIGSMGLGGLMFGWRDASYIVSDYIPSSQLSIVLLLAIALSVAGFIVQNRYVKQHFQE